ncbi:MAG: inositol monophosphatase family protein [Vicinamibacteria bacterium]
MKPLAVAVEAALAGGAVLKSYLGGAFQISYKGELNLVTEADLASEREVISTLRRRFPGAGILAEEMGESEGDSGMRFIVDPLDGTTNFAHGYAVFAVSIAYEEKDRVLAAAVYDPAREELFTAAKGRGAFLNGRRLRVSTTTSLSRAMLVTGFPYDVKEDLDGNLRLFRRFMGASRAVRRDGSAALDLCYLAAGRFDGFWEEKLGPWDTAAGALIVEEAGGRVTDLGGGAYHYSLECIVASNLRIHAQMLEVID